MVALKRVRVFGDYGDDYLSDGIRALELAEKAHSMYVRQDSFEKRKLLDLVYSNCELRGGNVKVKYRELFEIIADGVAEEARLKAKKVPFEARNENWLPALVSQSVILWDRACLRWKRIAKGRLTLRLLAAD